MILFHLQKHCKNDSFSLSLANLKWHRINIDKIKDKKRNFIYLCTAHMGRWWEILYLTRPQKNMFLIIFSANKLLQMVKTVSCVYVNLYKNCLPTKNVCKIIPSSSVRKIVKEKKKNEYSYEQIIITVLL